MLFNTCELQNKTAGQNTALTDCVLSTSDVTVVTSSSYKLQCNVPNYILYKTYFQIFIF